MLINHIKTIRHPTAFKRNYTLLAPLVSEVIDHLQSTIKHSRSSADCQAFKFFSNSPFASWSQPITMTLTSMLARFGAPLAREGSSNAV
jgi:hypothetical protein